MRCSRKGHPDFSKKKCPECCHHKAQVYLEDGPRCGDCGRLIHYINPSELVDLEAEFKRLKALEVKVIG